MTYGWSVIWRRLEVSEVCDVWCKPHLSKWKKIVKIVNKEISCVKITHLNQNSICLVRHFDSLINITYVNEVMNQQPEYQLIKCFWSPDAFVLYCVGLKFILTTSGAVNLCAAFSIFPPAAKSNRSTKTYRKSFSCFVLLILNNKKYLFVSYVAKHFETQKSLASMCGNNWNKMKFWGWLKTFFHICTGSLNG